jgi:hypothetical protein
MSMKPHIVVVGAGAFGGWIALYLLRGGARVTLLDAWGPGNSRASSGGETRIIRGAYGPDQPYTKLAARALDLWKRHEAEWKRKFFFPIGVLWMVERDDTFERGSIPLLKEAGIPFEQLELSELARRWPQISFEDVEWAIYEPQSGYLLARASTQAVVEQFVAEGGEYRQATVAARDLETGQWKGLSLSEGSVAAATASVSDPISQPTVTCSPAARGWGGCFRKRSARISFRPSKKCSSLALRPAIRATTRATCRCGGIIVDHVSSTEFPGNQGRGFKMADDTRGAEFDPTSGERLVSEENVWTRRGVIWPTVFPGLKDAPLAREPGLPVRKHP